MASIPSSDDKTGAPNGSASMSMVSVGKGNFGDAKDPPRELSWGDFKALADRTSAMQDRLDTLEKERQQPLEADEADPFLDDIKEEVVVKHVQDEEGENGQLIRARRFTHQSRRTMKGSRRGTLTESQIEDMEDENYELEESTYTLLTTQAVLSIPFATGLVAVAMSMLCLILAFLDEFANGTEGNRLGMPAGVNPEVRIAQYLGIIVGVLMESEIPNGLELIGKGVEQKKSGDNNFSTHRIILPSLLRIAVGYAFLMCMFLVVVQEETVLDIFFDILALEFVESIDDVIYELSKRGFFGKQLRVATNNEYYIETDQRSHRTRRWTKRFIRMVYILNLIVGLGVLTYYVVRQEKGDFRCNSVTVSLGDDVWEEAYVKTEDDEDYDDVEKKLLIFSHFSGTYVEDGPQHDGRPRYVERNKEDGAKFKVTPPAEIVYCAEISSWVLRHPRIRTALNESEENECFWLLRSPETDSYDIVALAEETEWFVWKGLVVSEYSISIECNECQDSSDCNYNGKCVEDSENEGLVRCICNGDHFGTHCQYDAPCTVIRSEKDNTTVLNLLPDPKDDTADYVEVYGRPMYTIDNLSGIPYSLLRLGFPETGSKYYNIKHPSNSTVEVEPHKHYSDNFFEDDDFFEVNNGTNPQFQKLLKNYTFVLRFTGRRWYGQIISPGLTGKEFVEEEYHAFWNNAFSGLGEEDNSTVIISAPTYGKGSPVGVDFFEMRRRNVAFEDGLEDYDYSPFGVLIPLVGYKGSGWFHCNRDDKR